MVILSGDHIYKMDYSDMVAQHKKTEAACTISVLEVTLEEAKRFGIMNANEDGQVYEFEEKPQHPKSTLASMGIYVFTWSKLRQYLIDDEADPNSSNDFGKNIIPNMLAAGEKLMTYRFSGYWKDVGTINSLWDANMDMLAPHSGIDLYDSSWPIYARSPIKPPHVTGPNAQISHSLVTGGCQVDGSVENSVRRGGEEGGRCGLRHCGGERRHRGGGHHRRAPQRGPGLGHRRGRRRRYHRRQGGCEAKRHDPGRCERR